MGKKWWYRRGLQTQLLLALLCLTPCAFAAQHLSSTVKKGKPGVTAKTSKPLSVKAPLPRSHNKAEEMSKPVRAEVVRNPSLLKAKTAPVSSAKTRKTFLPTKAAYSTTQKEKRSAKLEK